MVEYHVGCGLAGIYAGTMKKNGFEWLNKSDVTKEAEVAVAGWLLTSKKEFCFTYKGKNYVMRVEEDERHERE